MINIIKKKIDFSVGIFDNVTKNITNKIREEAKKSEVYGVGVYTDEIVVKKYKTLPKNNLEERMRLAKKIEGVDFVFSIDKLKAEEIKNIIEEECRNYLKK